MELILKAQFRDQIIKPVRLAGIITVCVALLISPCFSQTIITLAGDGNSISSGDGGASRSASVQHPNGVALDAKGNLYIADWYAHRIRRITPQRIITTVAGNGSEFLSGDGGLATRASLSNPKGAAVDSAGNLYIADTGNDRIRKVSPDGIISTAAGNGRQGFSGDGGPANLASVNRPGGVAVDREGNLYVADTLNHRIRRVDVRGIITTVAGNGKPALSGDDGPATSASLYHPNSIAVDARGNLYIADTNNSVVRKVNLEGTISTVAGDGKDRFSGDGGPAINASLSHPGGVAVDAAGNLYIADTLHSRIRKVSTSGTINTVAGNGDTGFSGDGGSPTKASLYNPHGVAVDNDGNLYIADSLNFRIRMVCSSRCQLQ